MKSKTEYAARTATQSGRKQLVKEIEALASRLGASVKDCTSGVEPRCVSVVLEIGACRCMMSFSGASRVGAFLGHWYVDLDAPGDFAPYDVLFAGAIRGSHNPYHLRKATTCCATLEAFTESLEQGIKFLANLPSVAATMGKIYT